jgi:uncharacterized protein (TIRG00374 family)
MKDTMNQERKTIDSDGRRWLGPALGYLLAVFGLVWVFHDFHPAEFWRQVVGIDWWWVLPALVLDVLSYLSQGERWRRLLRPLGRISTLRTTQAIYAGLFINEILPMRVGEIGRAYLVSRWLERPFLAVVPSMAVERLMDAVWLAMGIGLTAMFVPLPAHLLQAGDILGVVVLAGTALFLWVVLRRERAERSPEHPPGPLRRQIAAILGRLGEGLREIGLSRDFFAAFGASSLVLVFQALAFWLIMPACGLKLPFWAGMAVFVIVHLGTAIPNAPANIGSYQFFTVVGLALFGVEKTAATGFSVVVFILLTVPLWLLGLLALGRSGTTFSRIKADIRRLAIREAESRPEDPAER